MNTMPHQIFAIPCLQDNYAWLVHDETCGTTACIDVPDAAPILAELHARGWNLDQIVITHHHDDHIQGVAELRARTRALVIGAAADAHRLPPLDLAVRPGQRIEIAGTEAEVIDVPGHTIGHLAYHLPGAAAVFTADSLMALGCGRLFEGTPGQMWQALSRLAALPPHTLVCSGHEYAQGNARFALTIEPGNAALQARAADIDAARAAGRPTVPVTLELELATNPFLRAGLSPLKVAIGKPDADDATSFATIRALKDRF